MDWNAHLEHLQAILKEFDPATTPNKNTMICYFRKRLRPSWRAQLNNQDCDLDLGEDAVEKVVKAKAKVALQLPSGTREIDSRCLKGNRPSMKNNKEHKTTRDDKAKFHNSLDNAS